MAVPLGQGVQTPAPVLVLFVPASHGVHATPFESAEYPARQMQLSVTVPLLPASELVPSGQGVQAPAPGLVLYVPASHAAHATPSESAVCPAMQLQSPTPVLAEDELVPEGHAEHTPVPVEDLYVSAPHTVHTTPFVPAEYPARQMQLSVTVPLLPAAELVPSGQGMQAPAPGLVLYVPASHASHLTPSESAVCPAMQLQSPTPVLAKDELVPEGHTEHSPVPFLGLYVSTPHAVHSTPSDPAVCPATQMQSSTESLPTPEPVPDGHVKHTPVPVENLYESAAHGVHSTPFVPAEYPARQMQLSVTVPLLPAAELVPSGQGMQAPASGLVLYVPASHATHATPSESAVCPAMQEQLVLALLPTSECVYAFGWGSPSWGCPA